jgi:hypothetical protein
LHGTLHAHFQVQATLHLHMHLRGELRVT